MRLNENHAKEFLGFIIFLNLVAIGFIYLTIRCYLESKSAEYLYSLFFLFFFVAMDLLFFFIRKIAFSKVIIDAGSIKELYLKKPIKEIKIIDIKFIYIDINHIFLRSSEINLEEIGYGRRFNKFLYSKETINFIMNPLRIDIILSTLQSKSCYVSSRVPKDLKDKISLYMDIKEIQWKKKTK